MDSDQAVPPGNKATRRAFLLTAGGVMTVWSLHNVLLLPWEVRTIGESFREPLLVLLSALVWLVPVSIYVRRSDPRAPLVALGVTSRINRRGLVWSTVGALVYLGLIRFLVGAIDPSQQTPKLLEVFGRLGALYALLRSVLEELFMRGFLLGQLLRFTTSFRAQASVALLFACAHLPAWLALDGPSPAFLPSLIVLALLGAVLGKMTRASNSIVPAIVLHWVNNLLAS